MSRRRLRRLLFLGGLVALGAFADDLLEAYQVHVPAPVSSGRTVTVVAITDGDTFRSDAGPVRIDNIEAPDSERHPQRKSPECVDPAGAAAATEALAGLIPPGTLVELERTGSSYDRVVALVSVGGEDVGGLMLATGLVDPWPQVGGPCPGPDR